MRRTWITLLLATGCASSGPRLAELEADALYQYGLDRAADHKWNDAARALEQFIFQFPTHPRYQEARYRLGEVYFSKKDYLIAANEFSRLADDYPNGEWADDARYQVCSAYHTLSPKPQLDQEYTRTALVHCQSLLAYFPQSEYAPRARLMITELENKLARKIFLNGEHYFKRDAIDSAIIYFGMCLEAYPNSAVAPEALLRLYESYVKIDYTDEATAIRDRLLREFPDSEQAQRLKGSAGPSS